MEVSGLDDRLVANAIKRGIGLMYAGLIIRKTSGEEKLRVALYRQAKHIYFVPVNRSLAI